MSERTDSALSEREYVEGTATWLCPFDDTEWNGPAREYDPAPDDDGCTMITAEVDTRADDCPKCGQESDQVLEFVRWR